MEAIEKLEDEHKYIIQVVDALEGFAKKIEITGEVPVKEIHESIDFIKEFADRCHHGKEEKLLFPELEKQGMDRSSGPTAIMLLEHDEGRGFISDLKESLKDYEKGYDSKDRIIASIEGFVSLLRAHINKENMALFEMGKNMLPKEQKAKLAEDFEKTDREFGYKKIEEYKEKAVQLKKAAGF